MGLKSMNPGLKIMIAIGGWDAGTERFQKMAGSQSNRQTFINSLVTFMEKYGLDGFDLDWEFPTVNDKDNLSHLLQVWS